MAAATVDFCWDVEAVAWGYLLKAEARVYTLGYKRGRDTKAVQGRQIFCGEDEHACVEAERVKCVTEDGVISDANGR